MIRLWTLVFAFAWVGTLRAQTPDAGTVSPFTLGAGGRELAMGAANLTSPDPATAPFWNPSRLARTERFSLGGFYGQLYDVDATYQYVGLVAPTLDFGSFGLGIFRLGVNDIEVRDANNLFLGSTRDTRMAFYAAYGRPLSGFDLGISANVEHHSLAGYTSTSSPGLNLSISRSFVSGAGPFRDFAVLLQGQNLLRPSEQLSEERVELPYGADLAASTLLAPSDASPHSLLLAVALHKSDLESIEPRLGVEYAYHNVLRLRSGYRDGHTSFGGGLSFAGLSFDYALVGRDLGFLHTFALVTSFGVPISEQRQRRHEKRESDFRQHMQADLALRHRATVAGLVVNADLAMQSGDPQKAESYLSRALFMSEAEGLETGEIKTRLKNVTDKLESERAVLQLQEHLDSARGSRARRDWLSCRYFAGLALQLDKSSPEGSTLFALAETELKKTADRSRLVENRLAQVDSLVSSGRLEEAHRVARALLELTPEERQVKAALNKVRFELYRDSAWASYEAGLLSASLAALEKALDIYPQHAWCLDLKARAEAARAKSAAAPTSAASPAAIDVSAEVLRQVEKTYTEGQSAFESGDLPRAMQLWEQVERMVPDFKSVRTYLVRAYKFRGVELYGRGQLEEAVRVWKQAAELEPGQAEIAGYIRRTEAEMRKLRELTLGQR